MELGFHAARYDYPELYVDYRKPEPPNPKCSPTLKPTTFPLKGEPLNPKPCEPGESDFLCGRKMGGCLRLCDFDCKALARRCA